jgi:hypothetical protein
MHVDNAAPIPVPVQILIPRRYSFEVLDTPANFTKQIQRVNKLSLKSADGVLYLDLPSPYVFWWVFNQPSSEIALNATYHVVIWRVSPFRNDTESVVLQDAASTDSTEQPLLHTAIETQHSDLWRRLWILWINICLKSLGRVLTISTCTDTRRVNDHGRMILTPLC